jgi:hypothetical protein
MFGFAAIPAVLFLGLLGLVPESPRWLVKEGRGAEADAVLWRTSGPDVAEAQRADIQRACAEESGSLGRLFGPGLRTALGIGVALADFAATLAFRMMEESGRRDESSHRVMPLLVCAGLCIVSVLFVWRCVPETKGKSLEE